MPPEAFFRFFGVFFFGKKAAGSFFRLIGTVEAEAEFGIRVAEISNGFIRNGKGLRNAVEA